VLRVDSAGPAQLQYRAAAALVTLYAAAAPAQSRGGPEPVHATPAQSRAADAGAGAVGEGAEASMDALRGALRGCGWVERAGVEGLAGRLAGPEDGGCVAGWEAVRRAAAGVAELVRTVGEERRREGEMLQEVWRAGVAGGHTSSCRKSG
jgi:hypothetical protein